MEKPFAVIGKALRDYWDEAFNLMMCNLLWFGAQLLVIPGPPATAALFYVTNQVAHGRFARLADFWQAMKRYFLESWKWGALNLAAIAVFGYAALFYGSADFPAPFGLLLASLNVGLLLGWLVTQLFAFPMWLEQTDKRIGLALRNSLAIQAQNSRLMVLFAVLAIIVLALTAIFWVLLPMVAVALLMTVSNTIVVAQLEALREAADQGEAD